MHSSNSSSYYNPITYTEPAIPHCRPFSENDINSISKLEDPCSASLFYFPNSPHMHFEYEDVYLQFLELFYQQQSVVTADTIPADANATNMTASDEHVPKEDASGSNGKAISTAMEQLIVRKICSKKDRHSKINTARGPRDRRMRLSLDVARKFFDLQDLLGYDKASRTVDWLLKNSRPAIRELARGRGVPHMNRSCSLMGSNSASSTSDDCEVVSSSTWENKSTTKGTEESPSCTKKKRTKKIKVVRATVARESRRKARDRARERTSQKRRLSENTEPKLCAKSSVSNNNSLIRLKESGTRVPIYDMQTEIEDLSSDEGPILGARDEIISNPLVCTGPWNPSTLFTNYQDNTGVSYELAEFQFCGKPWEDFNSFKLSG